MHAGICHTKFLELSISLHVLERTGDGVVFCPASMPLMFDRKIQVFPYGPHWKA